MWNILALRTVWMSQDQRWEHYLKNRPALVMPGRIKCHPPPGIWACDRFCRVARGQIRNFLAPLRIIPLIAIL